MQNKIILASKSKVRKNNLDKNNIESVVEPSNVDEDIVKLALLKENATPEIISKNLAELKANKISKKCATETSATPGGGTLPGVEIPSAGLKLTGDHVEFFRQQNPPIICRVENNHTFLDLMTVHPSDDVFIDNAIKKIREGLLFCTCEFID